MRTDRELLELAAKAAGVAIPAEGDRLTGRTVDEVRNGFFKWTWNPLTDDGDALRLAVKLRFDLSIVDYGASVRANGQGRWAAYEAHLHGGIEAATRRAIVRAAAEIGAAQGAQGENNQREGD